MGPCSSHRTPGTRFPDPPLPPTGSRSAGRRPTPSAGTPRRRLDRAHHPDLVDGLHDGLGRLGTEARARPVPVRRPAQLPLAPVLVVLERVPEVGVLAPR